MYPRLSDFIENLLGFNLPFPIYSFGAMMAIAVLLAAWLTSMELERMYREGRIPAIRIPDRDGKGKRRSATKQVSPATAIGSIAIVAVSMGVVGAKIFHLAENPAAVAADPIGMIFSTGGLAFFGGVIVASISVAWYLRRLGIPIPHFFDAVAPGLMLAYGVGRIGCHLAGDGDWGIMANMDLKPDWLPMWLWAETYPNNILNEVIPAPGVYPTPLYEFAMGVALAGLLWGVRKHPFLGGWLFSLYIVLAGVERFLIEKIRVNIKYSVFGFELTQAEVIATLFIVGGGIMLYLRSRRREPAEAKPAEVTAA
jgi:phosphatidylglycerol---prolipoprotein diacylglyceryl transferase